MAEALELLEELLWTAAVTPFGKNGEINKPSAAKLYEYQIAEGANILFLGTTGESPTVRGHDHIEAIRYGADVVNGRCGTMAGTGANSTSESVELTDAVIDLINLMLLVDCYYNAPASIELRNNYHGYLAGRFPNKLFMPYIIPGRTGTALEPYDLMKLALKHKNIRAVKEARGELGLEKMAEERKLLDKFLKDPFSIYSGDDGLTAWYRKDGEIKPGMMVRPDIRAKGVVSVISNPVPYGVGELVKAISEKRMGSAEKYWHVLEPLFNIVTVSVKYQGTLPDGEKVAVSQKFRNPDAIKILMNGLGMNAGPHRYPLGLSDFEDPEDKEVAMEAVQTVRDAAIESYSRELDTERALGTEFRILRRIEGPYSVKIKDRLEDDEAWTSMVYK